MTDATVYSTIADAPPGAYHRVPGGWSATPAPEAVEGRKRYQPHDVDPDLFSSAPPPQDDVEAVDNADGSTGVDDGSTLPPASDDS